MKFGSVALRGMLLAATGLLGLLVIYMFVRSLKWPMIHDGAVMEYVAWRINAGAIPYRDVLDINMPGSFAIAQLEMHLFGLTNPGWRLFDLSILLASDIGLYVFCARYGRIAGIVPVLVLTAFHLFHGPSIAGQRDFIMLGLIIYSCLAIARFSERQVKGVGTATAWSPAMAGLLCGVAIAIKPTAVLFAAGALAIVASDPAVEPRRRLPGLLSYAAGCVLPLFLSIAWLAKIGGWPAFVDAEMHLAPIYLKWAPGVKNGNHAVLIPALGLMLLAVPLSKESWFTRSIREKLAFLGIVYGAIHFYVQAPFDYHAYPLIGFAGILAGLSTEWLFATAPSKPPLASTVLSLLLIGALISYFRPHIGQGEDAVPNAIAADIQDLAPVNGSVQILGTATEPVTALLYLRRPEATRFMCDYQFFVPHDSAYVRHLKAEFMADMLKSPPSCFVVMGEGKKGADYSRIAGFPELAGWLQEQYHVGVERKTYRIYLLNSDRAAS